MIILNLSDKIRPRSPQLLIAPTFEPNIAQINSK